MRSNFQTYNILNIFVCQYNKLLTLSEAKNVLEGIEYNTVWKVDEVLQGFGIRKF